jgi:hemerythrin superfamily protein
MAQGANVIDELVSDHREIEQIFGRLEALPAGDKDRKVNADQVTIELVRHSVAEEAYLYPAVREHVANGGALADKEIADHSRAEQIMKDLEGRDADDPEFDRLIGVLMSEIRSHVADEEENIFPKLRQACPTDALNELGDKVRQAKQLAPTRPHPAAPDKPPLSKLVAPGIGLVDRLRDTLTGRGKKA